MGCFVVAEFLLTSASRGPSAIAEPLVIIALGRLKPTQMKKCPQKLLIILCKIEIKTSYIVLHE